MTAVAIFVSFLVVVVEVVLLLSFVLIVVGFGVGGDAPCSWYILVNAVDVVVVDSAVVCVDRGSGGVLVYHMIRRFVNNEKVVATAGVVSRTYPGGSACGR